MAIVTLTTDVGQQDYLVGAIKGQLLSQNPNTNIVDITHYLSNTNIHQAAYICANAFKHYPAKTFHIIILNFFDTAINYLLISRYKDQYIICPDNGILTLIACEKPKEVVQLSVQGHDSLLARTSIIARAVDYIHKNGNPIMEDEEPVEIMEKYPMKTRVGPDWMEGQILFIDNFENVIVNIMKEEFEEQRRGRLFSILFARNETIDTISDNYASVNEGDILAWFNSAGYLELAVNKGNIAGLFGLQRYNERSNKVGKAAQNDLFYQTIKIFFQG